MNAEADRRRWLAWAASAAVAGLAPSKALAGGQLEEPLADSVRLALHSSVEDRSPPVPEFGNTAAYLSYLRWFSEMSQRLRRRIPIESERHEFLQTIWYNAKRARFDTSLILGLIQVESAFRRFAISSVGARGYMQVMPFWARLIGDGDASRLFNMQTNVRFGCVILRHYADRERGDMFMALGRYNGSRGRAPYPTSVFNAERHWVFKDKG